MDENQLVKQVLKNNKKAMRRFYKNYQTRLLNFILRKVDNRKDAEEILQDTFLSALDSFPLFKFNSSLYTWLVSITRHEIADFYRRRKLKTIIFSRLPFLEKIIDRALGPELALQEKEVKIKIFNTFKNLTEGYTQILRLKYIEGLTMVQIAFKLGKTVKAVESKLSRARLAFQKEYAKETGQVFKENWEILSSPFDQGELPF
jgi:RNA polymerase sigma-70 factor (ECF subfamily)